MLGIVKAQTAHGLDVGAVEGSEKKANVLEKLLLGIGSTRMTLVV
jgi:hypothetical protein